MDHDHTEFEASLNPTTNPAKMTRIMFETFSASPFDAAIHAVLSLYTSDRTTVLDVSVGDGVLYIVPILIYERYYFTTSHIKFRFSW